MEWTFCSTRDDYMLKIKHSYNNTNKKQNARAKLINEMRKSKPHTAQHYN
jgi:hypothetical protein